MRVCACARVGFVGFVGLLACLGHEAFICSRQVCLVGAVPQSVSYQVDTSSWLSAVSSG